MAHTHGSLSDQSELANSEALHPAVCGFTYMADTYCPRCAALEAGITNWRIELRDHADVPVKAKAGEGFASNYAEQVAVSQVFPHIDRLYIVRDRESNPMRPLYAEQVRDGYADGGPDCCSTCGRVLVALDVDGSGPGKFESNGHACHLAAYLHNLSLDGMGETVTNGEGYASFTLVGDWIVCEEPQGFVQIAAADSGDVICAEAEHAGLVF